MYKTDAQPNYVKAYEEYFTDNGADGHALPNATTTNCTNVLAVGKTLGSIEVKAVVTSGFTVASAQSITLTLNECDSAGGNAVLLANIATLVPATYAIGDLVAEFIIPSTASMYCKAAITATANQSTAGKIAIFLTYLAR